jgi:hypothetical protein
LDNVKRLYKLRSEVVHRGKFDGVSQQDLDLARAYAKAAAVRLLSLPALFGKFKSDSELNEWFDKLVLGIPALRTRKKAVAPQP